jgi:hypothetical protein
MLLFQDNQSVSFPSIMLRCLTGIFIIEYICIYTLFISFSFSPRSSRCFDNLTGTLSAREVEGWWLQPSAGVTADCGGSDVCLTTVMCLSCSLNVNSSPCWSRLCNWLVFTFRCGSPGIVARPATRLRSFNLFHLLRTRNLMHPSHIREILFRLNQLHIQTDPKL